MARPGPVAYARERRIGCIGRTCDACVYSKVELWHDIVCLGMASLSSRLHVRTSRRSRFTERVPTCRHNPHAQLCKPSPLAERGVGERGPKPDAPNYHRSTARAIGNLGRSQVMILDPDLGHHLV